MIGSALWQSLISSDSRGPAATVGKAILRGASWPYAAAVRLRNAGYDSGLLSAFDPGGPVVSVGNLSVGGSGKTPLVLHLLDLLRKRGRKPAVLTRGYGRAASGIHILKGPDQGAADWGDEPALIARRFPDIPVAVGADRRRTAREVLRSHPVDCFVLDDGFQHRGLRRALDIVCLDERILEAPHIFPRGALREPAESLNRAQFCAVKTRLEPEDYLREFEMAFGFRPKAPTGFFRLRGSRVSGPSGEELPESLRGKRAVLFSGIAHPEGFERLAEELGVQICGRIRFPDHHRYSRNDLQRLKRAAENGSAILLTTEKDRVKLPLDFPARAIEVDLEWGEGKERFEAALQPFLK